MTSTFGWNYTELFSQIKPEYFSQMMADLSRHGYIVAIEGLDGVGKTTLIEPLRKELHEKLFRNIWEIKTTKEPYLDSSREVIERSMNNDLRFYASLRSREAHYNEVIEPFKSNANHAFMLLSDRFYYSTVAYRMGRNVDNDKSQVSQDLELAIAAGGGVKADIAFLLECDVESSIEFQKQRGDIVFRDGTHVRRAINASSRYSELMQGLQCIELIATTACLDSEGRERIPTEDIVAEIVEYIADDIYRKFYSPLVDRKFYAG